MGLFDKIMKNKNITPKERRDNTIKQLIKLGIDYNPNLPLLSENVTLKNVEQVKKRIFTSMMCIQFACAIRDGENYAQSLWLEIQRNIPEEDFLPKEKLLIYNKNTSQDSTDEFTKQDIIDIVWNYEACWSLIWALDVITNKELSDASKICNTQRAMANLGMIQSGLFTKLRNTDKILDMLDLFYCYSWACTEKRINPNTKIGKLNPEIVLERRKGLEWLISEENDWDNISLNT